jgi:translation elongation factor EF-1alpha
MYEKDKKIGKPLILPLSESDAVYNIQTVHFNVESGKILMNKNLLFAFSME